jgi:hypothetical protein
VNSGFPEAFQAGRSLMAELGLSGIIASAGDEQRKIAV